MSDKESDGRPPMVTFEIPESKCVMITKDISPENTYTTPRGTLIAIGSWLSDEPMIKYLFYHRDCWVPYHSTETTENPKGH